jgi:hypothetical protein
MIQSARIPLARSWSKLSVLIGAGALSCAAGLFIAVCLGATGSLVGFTGTVYTFLVMGGVGLLGAAFAVVGLLKRERRIGLSVAGLALNLTLVVVGSCFLILLPLH